MGNAIFSEDQEISFDFNQSMADFLTDSEQTSQTCKLFIYNNTPYVFELDSLDICEGSSWIVPPPQNIMPKELFRIGAAARLSDWNTSNIFTGEVRYNLANTNDYNKEERDSYFKLGWKIHNNRSITEVSSSEDIAIEFHELEDHTTSKASIFFEIRENIKGIYVFSHEKLAKLVQDTNFDKFEVRDLYISFCKICKERYLDYNQFCNVFKEIWNDKLMPSLFNAFGNGETIQFDDFIIVLSNICRGPAKEKAIFLAKLFDPQRLGWISKDYLFDMLNSISKLMKMLGFDQKDYGDPEEVVDSIFTDIETQDVIYNVKSNESTFINHISTSKFIERCIHEPNLIECFGFFDYFYKKFVSPTEVRCRIKQIEVRKEICGWLEKDKSDSFFNWTFQFVSSRDKRWFLIKDGFMAYSKHPFGNFLSVMPLWDAVVKNSSTNPRQFYLDTTFFTRTLYAPTSLEAKIWTDFIRASSEEIHRYRSFAPVRTNISAKWIVNGKDYFKEIYKVIKNTKYRLLISGWYISPGLLLVRDKGINEKYRLDNVLIQAANRGVKIYILIWNAPSFSFDLKSSKICEFLDSLHENIQCLCIPNTAFPMLWSYHQKMVVSDDSIAFVGGIDICFGRYDDDRFLLSDTEGKVFPGMDYTNLYKRDEVNSLMENPVSDREKEWRLPWHDVQCRVNGLASKDISNNFIQIWNKALRDFSNPKAYHYLFPLTLIKKPNQDTDNINLSHEKKETNMSGTFDDESESIREAETLKKLNPNIFHLIEDDDEKSRKAIVEGLYHDCKCQVLRSSSQWNTGLSRPEQSIYKAYIHLIQTAQHYIYIQNQYFISSISRSTPKNRILEAIYRRICEAIEKNEVFRCIIVLPYFPGGKITHGYLKYIMHCTYKSISRGKHSILSSLSEKYKDVDISNYITFHTLRQIGELNQNLIAESVYVHSKLIIVDDRSVIIGSSNINDRSMRGTRDSEIAVLVEGMSETVETLMNKKKFLASKFALDLRIRLWSMFLGIKDKKDLEQIMDPVCDETYHIIFKKTSDENSRLYREIFPSLPENTYKISDLKDMVLNLRDLDDAERESIREKVKKIKGHYINFPHDFLKDENMSIGIFDKEFVLPKYTFM